MQNRQMFIKDIKEANYILKKEIINRKIFLVEKNQNAILIFTL